MSSFTDGNWEIKCFDEDDGYVILQDLAENYGVVSYKPIAEGVSKEANAHLISAAPDMYRALKKVIEDSHVLGYIQSESLGACDAALAKADGEV